jgi:hypothetical protein
MDPLDRLNKILNGSYGIVGPRLLYESKIDFFYRPSPNKTNKEISVNTQEKINKLKDHNGLKIFDNIKKISSTFETNQNSSQNCTAIETYIGNEVSKMFTDKKSFLEELFLYRRLYFTNEKFLNGNYDKYFVRPLHFGIVKNYPKSFQCIHNKELYEKFNENQPKKSNKKIISKLSTTANNTLKYQITFPRGENAIEVIKKGINSNFLTHLLNVVEGISVLISERLFHDDFKLDNLVSIQHEGKYVFKMIDFSKINYISEINFYDTFLQAYSYYTYFSYYSHILNCINFNKKPASERMYTILFLQYTKTYLPEQIIDTYYDDDGIIYSTLNQTIYKFKGKFFEKYLHPFILCTTELTFSMFVLDTTNTKLIKQFIINIGEFVTLYCNYFETRHNNYLNYFNTSKSIIYKKEKLVRIQQEYKYTFNSLFGKNHLIEKNNVKDTLKNATERFFNFYKNNELKIEEELYKKQIIYSLGIIVIEYLTIKYNSSKLFVKEDKNLFILLIMCSSFIIKNKGDDSLYINLSSIENIIDFINKINLESNTLSISSNTSLNTSLNASSNASLNSFSNASPNPTWTTVSSPNIKAKISTTMMELLPKR